MELAQTGSALMRYLADIYTMSPLLMVDGLKMRSVIRLILQLFINRQLARLHLFLTSDGSYATSTAVHA
jgi:hypothetical protein